MEGLRLIRSISQTEFNPAEHVFHLLKKCQWLSHMVTSNQTFSSKYSWVKSISPHSPERKGVGLPDSGFRISLKKNSFKGHDCISDVVIQIVLFKNHSPVATNEDSTNQRSGLNLFQTHVTHMKPNEFRFRFGYCAWRWCVLVKFLWCLWSVDDDDDDDDGGNGDFLICWWFTFTVHLHLLIYPKLLTSEEKNIKASDIKVFLIHEM